MKTLKYSILTIGFLTQVFLQSCSFAPYTKSKFTHFLDEPNAERIEPLKVDISQYENKYKGSNVVYQFREFTMEQAGQILTGSVFQELSKVSRVRYVVLNPDKEWVSTFNVTVDEGEKLMGMYAIVYNADGSFKKYSIADMKVVEHEKYKEYKIAYPNVKKGTIIEEGWQVRGADIFSFENVNLQFSEPIENEIFRLVYPSSYDAQIKKIAENKNLKLDVSTWSEDGTTVTTYSATNIVGLKSEPFSPYYKEIADYFICKATKVLGKTLESSTWGDVAKGFVKYNKFDNSTTDGEIGKKARDLTSTCTTVECKIDNIVNWVQNNFEIAYNAKNYSYDYFSREFVLNFEELFKSQKGSVTDINSLARVMLRSIKLESDFLLIRDARLGYFDNEFVSSSEFPIQCLQVRVDSLKYVVFPAIKEIPTSFVPEFLINQKAMEITPSGNYNWVTVKADNAGTSKQSEKYSVSINAEGLLTVKETKTYTGSEAYSMRESLKTVKKEDMEKEMKKLLTYSDGAVTLKNHTIKNKENQRMPLEIELEYTIDNLVTVTPDEILFQTGGLFAPSTEERERFESEERSNPIRIYHESGLEKEIEISYPKQWTPTTRLVNATDSNSFGNVVSHYTTEPGSIKVKLERTLVPASQPKEKIKDLVALIGKNSKLNIPTIVFKVQ